MALRLSKLASPSEESNGRNQEAQRELLKADRARDARLWDEAAVHYRRYLDLKPNDAGIWVQIGHSLKEGGKFDDADAAYRRSVELAPEEGDTYLQLGHLYKRMNKLAEAIEFYRRALETDYSLYDAKQELAEFGIRTDDLKFKLRAAEDRAAGILIDLSDVFFYLRHHPTVSGIQRVQLGISRAIGEMEPSKRVDIFFIAETRDGRDYVIVQEIFIASIWKELSGAKVEHSRLITLMNTAVSRGSPYVPTPGDMLLILGAFWVLENVAERINELRRQGVHVGTLIHDMIPITHPEFCEKSLTDAFRSYFVSVLSVVEFILTVSDHSGQMVKSFLEKNKVDCPPVRTLRLAHKTWEAATTPFTNMSREVSQVLKQEYVLYVSTIEIRKNHTYLFRIWKRLIQSRGKKVPCLVFVGRAGWRVDDLMAQLRSTNNLNGKVKILHDLSDTELAALYKSALFTVFPSFEEGWGLPVGESLLFGRPCLASSTSSIPEVAGEFVDYFDPFNENDGFRKIAAFIDDRKLLADRVAFLAKDFKPRLWSDVANDLIGTIKALVPRRGAASPAPLPRLQPGRRCKAGHGNDISTFIDSGDAGLAYNAFDTNWYPVENFGRWLRGREGKIAFALESAVTGQVILAIGFSAVHWLGECQLQVALNDRLYIAAPPKGQHMTVIFRTTLESEAITIDFNVQGKITAGPDPRLDLSYGVRWIGYANAEDPLSRLELLEEMLMDSGSFTLAAPLR